MQLNTKHTVNDCDLSSILTSEMENRWDLPRQKDRSERSSISPDKIRRNSNDDESHAQVQSEQVLSEQRKLLQSSIQKVRPPKLPLPLKDNGNPFQTVLLAID